MVWESMHVLKERERKTMLIHLHVKNLALIEETEVDFAEGLNILTGETGAGKSILIGSINLALGQRVSKDMIRNEEQPALVELVFDVNERCRRKLEELDISMEDSTVIISRRISGSRSISKINGETVPVTLLKQAAELLIDIHGQHEHQSLLKKERHLEILDEFAGEELETPKKKLREAYDAYRSICRQLEEFSMDDAGRERELAFLQYEIDEIANANLSIGEDEQLEQKFRRMQNGRRIVQALGRVYQLTSGNGEGSAAEYVSIAARELQTVAALDGELDNLCSQLQDVEAILEDFNRDASRYMEDVQFREEEYVQTEERLNVLNHLKSKYGQTIEQVFEYRCVQEDKLKRLSEYEQTLHELQAQKVQAEECLRKYSQKVSAIRKREACRLEKLICEALVDLNFLDVQFKIVFCDRKQPQRNGSDDVEFLISTNPGEPVRPLSKVASGGELSRIMLAIKTILADKDEIETLIFDEIDVGISGRTAQMVSEKMALIGRSRQVICITHLAQIAAMADHHFAIEKMADGKETSTNICSLKADEAVQELARLLGGAQITQTVLDSAKEMKELANEAKRLIERR